MLSAPAPAPAHAIGGLVERLFSSYGFIRGDDMHSYMFLRASVLPLLLSDFAIGHRVMFVPFWNDERKAWRAANVRHDPSVHASTQMTDATHAR